ncbi:MAG: DUF559 domain-containing protein [Solirubrobacteraceae bacterium]
MAAPDAIHPPRTRPTGRLLPVHWDRVLAELATAQHGVVAGGQLRRAGLTPGAIRHRLRAGRLYVLFPGIAVYAVGHRVLTAHGWWMASVLACGEGALLSHRAAGCLWGLLDGTPARTDVTLTRTPTTLAGVHGHRTRTITAADRAEHDGIPCTSVPRTLVDLATLLDERRLDRAVRRAEELRLYDRDAVEAMIARRRPGTRLLRGAVDALFRDTRDGIRTREELERRFLDLVRRHGFAIPATNVMVPTPWSDWEVDAFWPGLRLIIELDGWSTHQDRESFRRDHERTADLSAAGYRVVRLDWDQVVRREDETVARLDRLLPRLAA